MKKTFIHISAIAALFIFLFSGCTKDFEEINENPNKLTEAPPSFLLSSAQKFMARMTNDEWFSGRFGMLYSQYWSQTSYTDESRYKLRDGTNNAYWLYFYAGRDAALSGALNGGGIMDFIEIIRLNTDEATKEDAAVTSGDNENQIAVARILKAYYIHMLTDAYGDIPYFEAFKGPETPHPRYTPQEEIYTDLLKELTEAQNQIDPDPDYALQGDIIYGGDMSKWKKFANSLRLRIAMRMSKVDPTGSQAEIQAALDAGVFESNADNAKFQFLSSVPNNHPLNENAKEREDFALSKTLVDLMKVDYNNDPRLPLYGDLPRNEEVGEFVGFPYGLSQDEATALDGVNYSYPGTLDAGLSGVYAADFPVTLMDYAEVLFIQCEHNGYDQTLYEQAITASMEDWGVAQAHITEYIGNVPAASEQTVAEQKYIALYMQGHQAWAEWRRTGYPQLTIPEGGIMAPGLEVIPRRRTYPTDEQSLNEESYNEAVARLSNGDAFDSRMWWDVE